LPSIARSWIELRTPNRERELRLFCFHGAGGVAQTFRLWSRGLPARVEVCPVQLPGRLERMSEIPYKRFESLIPAMLGALEPELDGPFAFFGHSLGALLAFEAARELRRRKRALPTHLFVGARIAPHLAFEHIDVARLDDDALIAEVQRRYQSIPAEIMREPELLKLLLKPLRADLEVHASYVHAREEPLGVPMTVLGGESDRQVARDGLDAWREHTTGAFAMQVLPGGHYFHQEHEAEVLRIVSQGCMR
jgi:medium-chain acyl-[acyl-carrier-protein] hydrolase